MAVVRTGKLIAAFMRGEAIVVELLEALDASMALEHEFAEKLENRK